ncbi:hypothetical protein [Knoellia aerolata]|uniref:Uncharacterized protein n=1 Tax=Knoellia aerolata DSM 18566 TaxID=1385519 RepID=A0A0A0JT36_9MICO|nr:hypothetical protein [Knoellia aerolata]KGN40328.1 hypothetical protein N801_14815 [Knoellia aerolata DSM 18566]
MTSPSQKALRAVIAVASVGLALLTTLVAPGGSIVAALVLVALTPFVVLDPASRLTTVLLGLHAGNWLMSVPVPGDPGAWLAALVAAVALAAIHLAAALSSSFPAAATVPGATWRRWARRSAAVLGLSVPVWALLVAQSEAAPEGDPLLTYAALAALALLAFGFWQAGAGATPAGRAGAPTDPRGR